MSASLAEDRPRSLLRAVPLEAATFAPFGAVLAHDRAAAQAVNAGTAWRTDLAGFEDRDIEAAPAVAVYRLASQVLPLGVSLFERHPRSPQAFASLTVERFLVVVAPAGQDGLPDPTRARAFVGGRGSALRYARDQWHAPIMALDAGGDMLMLASERRDGGDTVEHRLSIPIVVTA